MSEENNKKDLIDKEGNINLKGLDISICGAVGDILAKEYYATITDEDKQAIFDELERQIFDVRDTYKRDGNGKEIFKKYFTINNFIPNKQLGWNEGPKDKPVQDYAKIYIQSKYCDLIKEQIEEITSTDKFKEIVKAIANEIVYRALNEYKNAMVDRILKRMIDDPIDNTYDGRSMESIIRDSINESISRSNQLMQDYLNYNH